MIGDKPSFPAADAKLARQQAKMLVQGDEVDECNKLKGDAIESLDGVPADASLDTPTAHNFSVPVDSSAAASSSSFARLEVLQGCPEVAPADADADYFDRIPSAL